MTGLIQYFRVVVVTQSLEILHLASIAVFLPITFQLLFKKQEYLKTFFKTKQGTYFYIKIGNIFMWGKQKYRTHTHTHTHTHTPKKKNPNPDHNKPNKNSIYIYIIK